MGEDRAAAGLRGRGRGADVGVGPRGIAAVGGRGAGGGDAGVEVGFGSWGRCRRRARGKSCYRGVGGELIEAKRCDSRGQMWGWDWGADVWEAPGEMQQRGWKLWGCCWDPSLGKYQ